MRLDLIGNIGAFTLARREAKKSTIQGPEKDKNARISSVLSLWGDKHIALQCYEHTTTSAFFEDWFEFELIPLLPAGAVIVMDNASFHRKNALWKIAEKYGVFVLFLPPYSPEFSPIEHSWANFKRWLCDNFNRFSCFDFAIETYFT